ncbi:MAG: hypothetical protein HZB26_13975 [Candidatus Hydrogenedentes bacterium]|nr:hypothetical protein [Candidatus Hydrogenedentota bacterium]
MKRLQRDGVVLALIEALRGKGSWCGETHVQKSTYFLQELLQVPLGFDFILYKHGPYSFDLSDALEQMRADRFLTYDPRPYPFGPSLAPDENGELLRRLFAKTRARYQERVDFLADEFASKNVAQLERIGTAMYVTLEDPERTGRDKRAMRIHKLKPHIPLDVARAAVDEFDSLREAVQEFAA